MTSAGKNASRASNTLVPHPLRFERARGGGPSRELRATVHCQRQQKTIDLDICKRCKRFARIALHDSGHVLLCRPFADETDGIGLAMELRCGDCDEQE